MKLLVVHEEAQFCELVEEFAQLCSHQFGIDCRSASSGQQCLDMLKSWGPAVVLLDVHLSDQDSFGIIDRCCSNGVQVVVMAEHSTPEMEKRAQEHGALGYFQKSDDPEDIEKLLAQLSTIPTPDRTLH